MTNKNNNLLLITKYIDYKDSGGAMWPLVMEQWNSSLTSYWVLGSASDVCRAFCLWFSGTEAVCSSEWRRRIKVSTSKAEAMVLCRTTVDCPFRLGVSHCPKRRSSCILGSCSWVRVRWNERLTSVPRALGNDRKNETADWNLKLKFVSSGLSLQDKVRSFERNRCSLNGVSWGGLGIWFGCLLLEDLWACPTRWKPWSGPTTYRRYYTSLLAWECPRKSWKTWIGRRISWLACCHRDLDLDNRQKTVGWTDFILCSVWPFFFSVSATTET